MILVNHYAIWPPIPKTIFIKHSRDEIIAFSFVLFTDRDRFFHFCCLFRQQFSAAYLLKVRVFLLPQRVHTTFFIRCDKPELTRWCLCSLHAGIPMSPAHLSPSTCKPLFMFWHLILCCLSPYSIPHAIIKCRMMILISYSPCLAARFVPSRASMAQLVRARDCQSLGRRFDSV